LEKLAEQYSSRIDFGLHKAIFFPTQVHQHWSLLVYSTLEQKLYSLDSGRTNLFTHTDAHYAPAIDKSEALVNDHISSTPTSDAVLTRSPPRLAVTVQPNGVGCLWLSCAFQC
jgi:hypothetical protein